MTPDLWKLFGPLDPYPLIRPFLFTLDPEVAHELTIKMLHYGLGPTFNEPDDFVLHTKLFGLDFPNPIGLAAGLDKQAMAIDGVMNFGFGHVELGCVTPKPQPGNPKPRMFRVKEAKGLINRFGFNSVGADVFAERLKAWRADPKRTTNPVGVNIGKNKETTDDVADYVYCLEKVAPYADYISINISSPNTPNLRALQNREQLTQLLAQVTEARQRVASSLPVLVKIAYDLTEAQQEEIAQVVMASQVQGVIVGNTTLTRPSIIPPQLAKEAGGLSGPLTFDGSTRVLANMYRLTGGKIPLVANCGVSDGMDAYKKIRAGASLVQIYTALIYEGPFVVRRIKRELAKLLKRDGFTSVADAVGK